MPMMASPRLFCRPLPAAARTSKGSTVYRRYFRGADGSRAAVAVRSLPRNQRASIFVFGVVSAGLLYLAYPSQLQAEPVPAPADLKFEEPRRKPSSREDNRDAISSQHLQVKRSWENPGVYAWGSNNGRVVAPDSDEANIKRPRRIPYFDGKLIRDIKLDGNFGAAIAENGDLLQWGVAFSPSSQGPTATLKGKDLTKLSISRDRIIALSSTGTVYSVAASQAEQQSGTKPQESTWMPFFTSKSPVGYRTLTPSSIEWGERVSDISSGLEHCLILTSKGRTFSAASGTQDFPSKGQLGIPGLTWATRPAGPYYQPHEISALRGFKISKIAAGDYHSLAVDAEGRVFSFGDNSLGQLGFDYSPDSAIVETPSILPISKLYKGSNLLPRVTGVAAGGANSFFTVDATRIAGQTEEDPRGLGRLTVDTWACGQGIWGALGNGRWTHVQGTPTKVKALSGLSEYNEADNTVVPIRLSYLSIGSTHASAIMDNVTNLTASDRSSENDTNWGADVLWWGGNDSYQLGTGKRNNLNSPTYIAPLDLEADQERGRREEHRFQATPRKVIRHGGRKVSVEQRIECGRGVSAVYSGT